MELHHLHYGRKRSGKSEHLCRSRESGVLTCDIVADTVADTYANANADADTLAKPHTDPVTDS
jgi:hypothetical protein